VQDAKVKDVQKGSLAEVLKVVMAKNSIDQHQLHARITEHYKNCFPMLSGLPLMMMSVEIRKATVANTLTWEQLGELLNILEMDMTIGIAPRVKSAAESQVAPAADNVFRGKPAPPDPALFDTMIKDVKFPPRIENILIHHHKFYQVGQLVGINHDQFLKLRYIGPVLGAAIEMLLMDFHPSLRIGTNVGTWTPAGDKPY
jgi:hypothetical protein